MILRTPDYYNKFKCIGSLCKHNCCIGWGVDIDEKSAQKYNSVQGSFGERLKNSMTIEDGCHTFIMNGERCPFLNEDNLCDIFINAGEDCLCNVCTEYPRFGTQYGGLLEKGLGFSCEEAAKIILSHNEPVYFVCSHFEGGEEEIQNEDKPLFDGLVKSRTVIFNILQNRLYSVWDRILQTIKYTQKVQEYINMNEPQGISSDYKPDIQGADEPDYKTVMSMLEFIAELEPMEENWKEIVLNVKNKLKNQAVYSELVEKINTPQYIWEQIAVYFIYRYYFNAMYNYDALSKVKFMAVCVVMIRAMAAAADNVSFESIIEIVRCFCANIEHSQDNMDAVFDEILFNPNWNLQ